jgi:hypothetical protein
LWLATYDAHTQKSSFGSQIPPEMLNLVSSMDGSLNVQSTNLQPELTEALRVITIHLNQILIETIIAADPTSRRILEEPCVNIDVYANESRPRL